MAVTVLKKQMGMGSGGDGPSAPAGLFKKGLAAHAEIKKEDEAAESAKLLGNRMFRFWMNQGEERKITFLDGELDDNGLLDILSYKEHGLKVNGRFTQFVCLEDITGVCPICESGDRASLVGVFTVIDHTPYQIQKGEKAGQVVKDQRKLFVAKRGTLKILQKTAQKRDGLAGCTFDVNRTGDKSPQVGDMFEFIEKRSLPELVKAYGEAAQPADYQKEVPYHPAEELIKLGIGTKPHMIGNEAPVDTSTIQDQL